MKRLTIRQKILRDSLRYLALVAIPVSALFIIASAHISLDQQKQNHDLFVRDSLGAISEALWRGDTFYGRQIVHLLITGPSIERVTLYDENNQIVFGDIKEMPTGLLRHYLEDKLYYPLEFKVNDQTHSVGSLVVHTNFTRAFYSLMGQTLWVYVAVGLLFIVILGMQYLYLKKWLMDPLYQISQAMLKMSDQFVCHLPVEADEVLEIQKTKQHFNFMAKKLEDQSAKILLQQSQLVQSSKMSALGEMASGVAHEINNPLSVIVSRAVLLKKKIERGQAPPDFIVTSLDKIEETAWRIEKIIRALRSFARQEDQLSPMQKVTLKSLVDETLDLCFERFKAVDLSIKVEVPEEIYIFCHPTQISQVFLNLFNNAFDAISAKPNPWIRIAAHIEGRRVIIQVQDAGDGIPFDVSTKIMQPFFSTKDIGKGTGLGLSISLGIIENHGGSLYLDPTQANTTFVIRLPRTDV